MNLFVKGGYAARLAETERETRAAQRLRYETFVTARGLSRTPPAGCAADGLDDLDADHLDEICDHVLVEEQSTGRLVCCFRILPFASGAGIGRSYSAQHYDLQALSAYPAPMVEMGRFCVRPGVRDPNVIRTAWSAMTGYVDARGVEMLFGCSSFEGVEAEAYLDAFALLNDRHLAPKRWLPRVKAPKVFRFAKRPRLPRPDVKKAFGRMPPLLRTYIMMGGWVSDHAVVDDDLNTLHVFTGLEVKSVPAGRAQLLRGVGRPAAPASA